MEKVSIIIPVIRPQNVDKLKQLIAQNAGYYNYVILFEEDKDRIGAPKMVKKLTDKAKTDLVMYLGDDCEPKPNFLKNAVEAMATLPDGWGLVGLTDEQRPGEHAPAHWLSHKKMLEHTGGEFFHTGYIHQYCDNELYIWAICLKRYVLCDTAIIDHKHIGFSNKEKSFTQNVNESNDEDMKRVYSNFARDHDKNLFEHRKQIIIDSFNRPSLPLTGERVVTGDMKKYKIIIGNNNLDWLGGSETWLYTLAKELKSLGHQILAYSPTLGFMASKMEEVGIDCVNEITDAQAKECDFVICNHYAVTKYLRSKMPDIHITACIHGIMHKDNEGNFLPEHPAIDTKVDQYVAVSEEVQNFLLEKYKIKSELVRNFYDLERFKYVARELPEKPKTLLVNSNYWKQDNPVNSIIKQIAIHYGAQFIGVGIHFVPTFEVEEAVAESDVVFGMGRSVIEGVCMGRLGVVHGRWGTGGVLTPETYELLKRTNFSGRNWKRNNSLSRPADIIEGIDKAWNVKNIEAMRKIMEEHHNVKIAAKKLIEMSETK